MRCYIFLLLHTCKFIRKEDIESRRLINSQRCIFAIWHSRILLFPALDFPKVTAVVSAHGDGELIASVLTHYGHKSTRGSSRKQSFTAMKGLISALKDNNKSICITPDGPKGPRYTINGNITNIAAKYNLPIIPLCFSASKAIVLKTWDRFLIPLPFSKIYIDINSPIYCSSNVEENDLLRKNMNDQMVKLDKTATLKIDY